jgi:hypothetical protein
MATTNENGPGGRHRSRPQLSIFQRHYNPAVVSCNIGSRAIERMMIAGGADGYAR